METLGNLGVWARKAPYLSVVISIVLLFAVLRWNLSREARTFQSEFIRQNLSELAAGDVLALTPRLEALSNSYHWTCIEGARRGVPFFSRKIGQCGSSLTQKEVVFGLAGNRDISITATLAVPRSILVVASFLLFGQVFLLVYIARSARIVERIEFSRSLEKERSENEINRSLAAMTAMLAHDARRPLTISRLALNLFAEAKDLSSVQKASEKYLVELDRAVKNIDGLIDDVMELANNSNRILKVPVELTSVLDSSLKEVLRLNPVASIKFHYDLSHEHLILANHQKLQRVFSNIIANATEAIDGRGDIWFSTYELDGFIHFSIKNIGSFIPDDSIKKLFDMFFTDGKPGGTGLGLAIAKKIIHTHDGEIWCTSRKDREFPSGMVDFKMTLPVVKPRIPCQVVRLPETSEQVAVSAMLPHLGRAKNRSTAHGRPAVAVIDDSLVVTDAWASKLSGDADVQIFDDPDDFLRRVGQDPTFLEQLDYVIVDYYFETSSKTGLEVAGLIKMRRQELPVILSSNKKHCGLTDDIKSIDLIVDKTPMTLPQLIHHKNLS